MLYSKERKGYRLDVFHFNGYFTAMLTNITTGASRRDDGWTSYKSALEVVQRMYEMKVI